MVVLRYFCCCGRHGARLAPIHVALDEEAEELVEHLRGALYRDICCCAVSWYAVCDPKTKRDDELREPTLYGVSKAGVGYILRTRHGHLRICASGQRRPG